jgi:hypothetical protein
MSTDTNSIPTLGRIRTIELREVWASEPYAFTPWLAQAENLQFLAESIGLPGLELVETERPVDIFAADIVAKAADTGETVLIENQIERSDHTHLGQILTYAAGLEAAVIIWISKRFTDGHRAAIDWLNRITGPDFAFFAIEVEAVRIGDSLPAPRFNVVSRPNDWARSLRAVSRAPESQTYSDASQAFAAANQAYWNGYQAKAELVGAPIRRATSQTKQANYYVRTGVPNTFFSAWRSGSSKTVGVYLSIFGNDAERIFQFLRSRQSEIEQAFGGSLDWSERRLGAGYWVVAGQLDVQMDEADWPRQQQWIAERMKKLAEAVGPTLAELPSGEESSSE